MSALLSQLKGLVSGSEAADYSVTGYHHKHKADASQIVAIGEAVESTM